LKVEPLLTMKMKSLPLFSLLLVPQLAFAQPRPSNKQITESIANSIEKSALPYLKVKTFSGNVDLTLTEFDGKEMKPVLYAQLRTIYQLDKAGNKIREVSTYSTRTTRDGKPVSQTVKVVDDGKTQTHISPESKTYALTPRYNEVAPFALLSPVLKRIASLLRRDDSVVSSKTVAGPVTLLESEGDKFLLDLYGIIDNKTGALEMLDFSAGKTGIKIMTLKQVFNPHLNDSQFKWTPPAGFKRVAESQIPNPMQGMAPKRKTAPARVY
jgi:outer membrane lipoprotein-sorting protein